MSAQSTSTSAQMSPTVSISSRDRPKPQTPGCRVCGLICHGYHFGILTCRACAAFFRRTVALKKTYKCRGNFDCEISKEMRNMCRLCRFKKCKQLGMKAEDVQLFRDHVGSKHSSDCSPAATKRMRFEPADEALPQVNLPTPATTSAVGKNVCSNLQYSLENGPILEKLREGYQNFQSSLKSLCTVMHSTNIFADFGYEKVTHTEFVKTERGALSLMLSMLNEFYTPFEQLPQHVKVAAFRNFSLKFSLLNASFANYQNPLGDDPPKKWILHANQYVDMDDLDDFFKDDRDPGNSAKLFLIGVNMLISIKARMSKLQMDETEVAALGGIMLWNEVAHLQAEEDGISKR